MTSGVKATLCSRSASYWRAGRFAEALGAMKYRAQGFTCTMVLRLERGQRGALGVGCAALASCP